MAPAPLLNTAEQEPHNQSTFKDQHRELPTRQECDSTIAYLKPPTHFYLDWLRLHCTWYKPMSIRHQT